MHLRTLYYKVKNIPQASDFWRKFFDLAPSKESGRWVEFQLKGVRIAFLLNDFEKSSETTNCVPVFELTEPEFSIYLDRAKMIGAQVVIDGMADPNMQCIVLRDVCGNEFELCKPH